MTKPILDLLKKHPTRWFTSREIIERLDISSARIVLLKMRRIGFVDWKLRKDKKINREIFVYRHKE